MIASRLRKIARRARLMVREMRTVRRIGPAVLMYHGIVEHIGLVRDQWTITLAEFEKHLDYLHNRFQIISAQDMSATLESQQLSATHVVLTFDDAFRNLVQLAAPAMESRQLPYSVGVPIGLNLSGRTIWSLEVRTLFAHSPNETGKALSKLVGKDVDSGNAIQELRKLPEAHRRECCESLIQQLSNVYALAIAETSYQLATPRELQSLDSRFVTFMGHGYYHSWMRSELTPQEIHREIAQSRDEIDQHIGAKPDYYIYPNGIDETHVVEAVQSAGYRAAFAAGGGDVSANVDVYRIPRYDAAVDVAQLRKMLG